MSSSLSDLPKRLREKTRDIFLLALNCHSIDSMEHNDVEDADILREKLELEWKKYNEKLVLNGHSPIHWTNIQNLSDAHDMAYLTLNTKDKIKQNIQ